MLKLDDEQLEGSGFVLNGIVNVILEIYKINDIQASSYIELPEKFRNNRSIINIKMMINIVFYGLSWRIYIPLGTIKVEHQIIQCIRTNSTREDWNSP